MQDEWVFVSWFWSLYDTITISEAAGAETKNWFEQIQPLIPLYSCFANMIVMHGLEIDKSIELNFIKVISI